MQPGLLRRGLQYDRVFEQLQVRCFPGCAAGVHSSRLCLPRFGITCARLCHALIFAYATWQLTEHLVVLTIMTPQTATLTVTATTTRDGASATRFTRLTTTRESSKPNGGCKFFGKGRTAVMRRPMLQVTPQTRKLAYHARTPVIAPASTQSLSADHNRPCIFQH